MVERFKPKFIFIMGTTASGKSQLALDLAMKYRGAIINCDSLQVYHGLDIGTAKPTLKEMQLAPHFLFSYVNFPRTMTAGEYTRDFYELLNHHPEHQLYFVVGGTGFYFQALERGMYPVHAADPHLKDIIEKQLLDPQGAEQLWDELMRLDPDYGLKIHRADHYRLGRAIELMRTEQRTVTEIQKEFLNKKSSFAYPYLKIGCQLEKEQLSEQIRARTQGMLDQGLVNETLGVIEKGWREWSPLASVGYREVLQYLQEIKSEKWLEDSIHQSTMQLAKKQRTWFKRDSEIQWFHPQNSKRQIVARVDQFLTGTDSI